jgi:hypothetical protein
VAGEVVLLDQQNLEATARRIARDAGTVDAAADDQQIDLRVQLSASLACAFRIRTAEVRK